MSNLDTKLASIRKRLDNIIHKNDSPELTDGKTYSDFNKNDAGMRTAGLDYPVALRSTAHLSQRRREQLYAPKPYGEKVDISLIPLEGADPISIRSIAPLSPEDREKQHAPILDQSMGESAPRHPTQGFLHTHHSNTIRSDLLRKRSDITAVVDEYVQTREKLNERIDALVKATERRRAGDASRKARAAEARDRLQVMRERMKSKLDCCNFVYTNADIGIGMELDYGRGKMVDEEEDADWTKVEAEEWVMVPKYEDY